MKEVIYQTAVSAQLAPRKEARNLIPDSEARPGDVFLPSWTRGRDTCLDVVVVNPLQQGLVAQAAVTPGHALTYTFNRKNNTHQARCEREGMVFFPLAVETLGGWHEVSADQLKRIGRALARSTGQDEDECLRHFFQRLGVMLVRGNASLLLNRLPVFPSPEVDGDE